MAAARLRFTVATKPLPKARPRVGRGRAYTPARTVAYEAEVRLAAKLAMAKAGLEAFSGPVGVALTFAGASPLADVDNLCKAALDAMNGVVYADDCQVDELRCRRVRDAASPLLTVEVYTL